MQCTNENRFFRIQFLWCWNHIIRISNDPGNDFHLSRSKEETPWINFALHVFGAMRSGKWNLDCLPLWPWCVLMRFWNSNCLSLHHYHPESCKRSIIREPVFPIRKLCRRNLLAVPLDSLCLAIQPYNTNGNTKVTTHSIWQFNETNGDSERNAKWKGKLGSNLAMLKLYYLIGPNCLKIWINDCSLMSHGMPPKNTFGE